ncbi:unnamed protein product [Lymnaea stagnalis]|uniref:CAP-Gly domain-containing protein n=1 Tax=Lymnaea stagnalis TaxID=6523 RepID=A0AAV2I3V0_LYMST
MYTSSFQRVAVQIFETKKLQEKEREIKAKLEQIEELKGKYTKEQDENKILKQKLDNLANIQSDAGRKLFRAQEVAEKLQIENNKKSDHIEKLERNISHMEDRIRNLEIRASEVERAELTLESTRRNLESCQHEIKVKERELERANEKHEETCKQLDAANVKIKEMGDKMEDLKVQIRHELSKTETIEKGLETIPRLKEEIKDKQEKVSSLEKELEEKSALLNASRKSSRDLKEKLRDLESRDEKSQELKEELEMIKNEVTTLKRLMASKDVLVQQKCHALDQAKAEVDALFQAAGSYDEQTRLKKVTQVLARLQQLHLQFVVQDERDSFRDKQAQHSGPSQARSRSLAERESDPSNTPNTHGTSSNKENRENVTHTSGSWIDASKKQQRPKTSMSSMGNGSLVQRSASFHHLNHSGNGSGVPSANRSHSPRVRKSDASHVHSDSSKQRRNVVYSSEKMEKLSSKYRPSLDYPLGLSTDEEMTTESSRGWSGGNSFRGSVARPKSAYAGLGKGGNSLSSTTGSDTDTYSQECSSPGPGESAAAWRLTKRDKKLLAGLSSAHQDAILSDIIQMGDRISIDVPQKPPRYGRKKPKPVTFTGIVKFKGQLEKSSDDNSIYVGVRLDLPIGDSDGVYKGMRYLFTPPEQAKFFKIRDLDSVLDVSVST